MIAIEVRNDPAVGLHFSGHTFLGLTTQGPVLPWITFLSSPGIGGRQIQDSSQTVLTMASKRSDRDHRRYDDDDRADRRSDRHEIRKEPEGRSSRGEAKKSRSTLHEYFISKEGIHREVLQRKICRFLGPEATSRPAKYNVCSVPSTRL